MDGIIRELTSKMNEASEIRDSVESNINELQEAMDNLEDYTGQVQDLIDSLESLPEVSIYVSLDVVEFDSSN